MRKTPYSLSPPNTDLSTIISAVVLFLTVDEQLM
jgi:hypothetical protein